MELNVYVYVLSSWVTFVIAVILAKIFLPNSEIAKDWKPAIYFSGFIPFQLTLKYFGFFDWVGNKLQMIINFI